MESAANISSEQELLQLRSEGKITETEYQDLLGAMSRTAPAAEEASAPTTTEQTAKRNLGKTAFCLMLAGIILPTIVFLISFAATGGGEGDVIFSVCLALCVLLELPALVFGVISWPDTLGKATVASIIGVILLLVARWILPA
ncbi:MAG: hypothetical protein JXN61_12420 [Sedimentisphaerales bacterium]|nr:hypothetical protein [Sedimentisphaerales bacterium]